MLKTQDSTLKLLKRKYDSIIFDHMPIQQAKANDKKIVVNYGSSNHKQGRLALKQHMGEIVNEMRRQV